MDDAERPHLAYARSLIGQPGSRDRVPTPAAGVGAILVTSPVAGAAQAERAARLAQTVGDFRIVVDHVDGAAEFGAAALGPMQVLIDVDPGMGRTGVGSPERAMEAFRAIAAQPTLKFPRRPVLRRPLAAHGRRQRPRRRGRRRHGLPLDRHLCPACGGRVDPTLDRYDVIHFVRGDVLAEIDPIEARGASQ